jgi:hypothetical protein
VQTVVSSTPVACTVSFRVKLRCSLIAVSVDLLLGHLCVGCVSTRTFGLSGAAAGNLSMATTLQYVAAGVFFLSSHRPAIVVLAQIHAYQRVSLHSAIERFMLSTANCLNRSVLRVAVDSGPLVRLAMHAAVVCCTAFRVGQPVCECDFYHSNCSCCRPAALLLEAVAACCSSYRLCSIHAQHSYDADFRLSSHCSYTMILKHALL